MAKNEELEARIQQLETRLEAVEAVEEIRCLKARYGELVDSRYGDKGPKDPEEIGRIADEIVLLFAKDAVWDGGEELGLWQRISSTAAPGDELLVRTGPAGPPAARRLSTPLSQLHG